MSSLFARLSFFFFLILLTLGLATVSISHRKSQDYFLEFTQRLNSPIAMYMAENAELLKDGQPDSTALARLASHIMIINPSVEVYLLDRKGNITAAGTGLDKLTSLKVAIEPIERFLETENTFPLFGDNPLDNNAQNIFSAFPLIEKSIDTASEHHLGYVYVVLAGEKHQSLLASLSSNYSFNSLIYTLASVMALALLAGVILFFMLTKRLRHLTHQVRHWNNDILHVNESTLERLPGDREKADRKPNKNGEMFPDEIETLKSAYQSMSERLMQQYQELQANDHNRRTLFANISHDLRTPLTTMQSYLETLILKESSLGEVDRRNYIQTAHSQSERLRRLVMQLFELSKLDAGDIAPQWENFSALELAHDSCQYFAIQAEAKGISLTVRPENDRDGNFEVLADIALLHRVFENLLSNALRYTSEGGTISIRLSRICSDRVEVVVGDTGTGLSQNQINRIFERRYRTFEQPDAPADRADPANYAESQTKESDNGNAGLGLSIVKSIVELHNSDIKVHSKSGIGTEFTFSLPASAPTRVVASLATTMPAARAST